MAVDIVAKIQGIVPHGHLDKLAAVVHIAVGGCTIRPAGTHTVGIVGICPGGGAVGHGCQLSALLPCVGPYSVTERISDTVVGYSPPVVGGQQISPLGIAVGIVYCIAALCPAQDISFSVRVTVEGRLSLQLFPHLKAIF